MEEFRYSTYLDGKFLDVPTTEECLLALRERMRSKNEALDRLKEENEKLRSEKYKDEEMQKLSKELENARKELRLGFGVSEEEHERVQAWMRKHEEEDHGLNTYAKRLAAQGVSGGRYAYVFVPTALGTFGSVRCVCGKEFQFREVK